MVWHQGEVVNDQPKTDGKQSHQRHSIGILFRLMEQETVFPSVRAQMVITQIQLPVLLPLFFPYVHVGKLIPDPGRIQERSKTLSCFACFIMRFNGF